MSQDDVSQDDLGQDGGRQVSRRLVVIVVVAVAMVGALGGLVWQTMRSGPSPDEVSASPSAAVTSPVAPDSPDPSPSDPADPAPSDSQTPCTEENPCLDPPLPPVEPGSDVNVLVTSSGWDPERNVAWVAADIPVLDPSGTCTATLRRGSTQVVQEASAEPGPRTTTCAVEVEGARLTTGEWLVSLSYLSAQHSGSAADVSINVP